ncbi:tyrosine-type recombinase/integrase [Fulvivirgaceae bacterium BMA10]|uniref:Tyrosine-type recombinase/integrase n=1 Tax=Splendidivirga corallicola TaxID=3051826 RepID=A0ABT8KY72_9BACT|nr:tyrosine-type recombinase/integrase [Fulvivirgaceae bacterium BMA10]
MKHKCILSLIYSAGLRRGALINLKLKDIDSKRMLTRVEDAKGGKDRYTLLGQNVLKDLRKYYQLFKPVNYLFKGEKGGKYGGSSIINIIKRASLKLISGKI